MTTKQLPDIDWQHHGVIGGSGNRLGSSSAISPPTPASVPIAARRRALVDRILAMDGPALAAMERCVGMIEGTH